jgi:hypothetical protein
MTSSFATWGFFMPSELKKAINEALESLPDVDVIRGRIAQNLQERQMLRRLLKLAKEKPTHDSESERSPQ